MTINVLEMLHFLQSEYMKMIWVIKQSKVFNSGSLNRDWTYNICKWPVKAAVCRCQISTRRPWTGEDKVLIYLFPILIQVRHRVRWPYVFFHTTVQRIVVKSSDCILLTLNILFVLLQSKFPGNLDLFLLSMLHKSLNEVIRVSLIYENVIHHLLT